MTTTVTPSGVQHTIYDADTYDAFPCVIALKSGRILATWQQDTGHMATNARRLVAAWSGTDGTTWSEPYVIQDTPDVADGGYVNIQWPDGEVGCYVNTSDAGANRRAWFMRSTDDGRTFGPQTEILWTFTDFTFPADFYLLDDGTTNGRLLGVAYGMDTGDTNWSVRVVTSTDRGVTWSHWSEIVNGNIDGRNWNETQLLRLPSGELLAAVRVDDGDRGIYLTRSNDLGATWSPLEPILPGVSGQPSLGYSQGTLLLSTRTNPETTWDFGWATSDDNGVTWTPRSDYTDGTRRMMYARWANLPSSDDVLIVYGAETSRTQCGIFAQRFDVTTEAPPPPDQVLPPATTAVARTSVTWHACDLVTGQVLADLPELRGQIGRVLGAYTSTTLNLPIPLSGPGELGPIAFEATIPGIRMLVAVVNDVPSWGGIVLVRNGGSRGTLELSCVTLEGYLERRYVGDHDWVNVDQTSVIAAGLLADANDGGIGLTLDTPASGRLRTRTYFDKDDATVYARLRELAGVQGGPEWTIDLEWADEEHTTIAKIVRVRDRIGKASEHPDAIFEALTSSETTYQLAEDYTADRGANDVMATGTGEGEDRPQSAHHRDVRPGWPVYERRFAPDTGSSDPGVLDDHAAAELELMVEGANTWTIANRWDREPRLNLDWALGDDIAWELTGHRHPDGVKGHGRAIGWTLDLQSGIVEPVLWSPNEETS